MKTTVRKVRFLTLASSVFAASAAWATITWNDEMFPTTKAEAQDSGNYVYLKETDPTNPRESSYTNSVRWSDSQFVHSDANYFAGSVSFFITPNTPALWEAYGETRTNYVFSGKRVVIGSGCTFGLCTDPLTAANPMTFGPEGFFSANGTAFIGWGGHYAKGPFTILNDATAPFRIHAPVTAGSTYSLNLYGPWASRDVTKVIVTRQSVTSRPVGAMKVKMDGDMTDFAGLLAVETNCCLTLTQGLPNGMLQLGYEGYTGQNTSGLAPAESGLNGEFTTEAADNTPLAFKTIYSNGGTLIVSGANRWTVTNELKFNKGILKLVANEGATDTASLTAAKVTFEAKPVKLVLSAPKPTKATPTLTWKVLSAPSGAFEADDFLVENPDDLDVTFADDGTTATLTAVRRGVVETRQAFAYKDAADVFATPFDSDKGPDKTGVERIFWTDDRAPHGDADYVIKHETALPCNEMGFYDKFQGHSLTINSGVNLSTGNNSPLCAGFFADDLRVAGCTFSVWAGDDRAATKAAHHGIRTFRLDGGLTAMDNTATYFRPYGGKNGTIVVIDSQVKGGGTLAFSCINAATPNGYSYNELTALNTNYTGRIVVTHDSYTKDDVSYPNDETCTRLFVADGRNLGGPISTFKYNWLQVERMSVIVAYQSLTLDQQNRGVFASGTARFEVQEGYTLTVKNPVTLNGTLRKEGAGTLALGGKLRFGMNDNLADATAPAQDLNAIRVIAGAVKPVATNALDGAELRFDAGASLVYDLEPTGEGMKDYGPVNLKWATPIVADADAKKVPVTFDLCATKRPADGYTLALGTFPSKVAAESVAAKLDIVRKPYPGSRTAVTVRENADGTGTVLCTFSEVGMVILFR